jgi:RNA polymerase sigma-70 factor (ECF subfamily)
MDGLSAVSSPGLVSRTDASDLDREFEQRLAEGATLAFRVAYAVLRQREDAEDVAQETLMRAYRRRHTLNDRARFRAWLVRIGWRLALDHRRGTRRRELRERKAGGRPADPSVEQVAAESEFRERLWAAIDALPEKLRAVLVLAGIEGHGVSEVAALLELPEGTVKSRMHLARRRLLEELR